MKTFKINAGDRPSRLELGRYAAGELDAQERAALEARLGPAEREWLDTLPAPPPFNAEILQKAAYRLSEEETRAVRPTRSSWTRWLRWLAPALVAAVAVLVVFRPHDTGIRGKGKADLDFYVLRGDQVQPGDPSAVHRPGDRLQFTYRAEGASSLVLLSVDGNGAVNVFYPATGDEPVAIEPEGRHVLPGSLELDDAPDFELFLAFFGATDVSGPKRDTSHVYQNGGVEALLEMAEASEDVDALFLRKEAP